MSAAGDAQAPFAGILLAAGRSSRMGRCKAALEIGGVSFVARCVQTYAEAGLDPIVVVVGEAREEVTAALPARIAVRLTVNPNPERGQLSSLHEALRLLLEQEVPCSGAVVGL